MITPAINKLHRWGRSRCTGGEEGSVIVAALAILVVVALLLAAAVTQALSVASKANRDPLQRAAIEAADTGARTALYRLNSLAQYLADPNNPLFPCIGASVDGSNNLTALTFDATVLAGAQTWCPATPREAIGNNETFSYQMTPILVPGGSPPDPDGLFETVDRRIVATGYTSLGARTAPARVVETASAFDPAEVAKDGLVGQSLVTVQGSAKVGTPTAPVSINSAGGVTVSSSANGSQCGNIAYTTTLSDPGECSGLFPTTHRPITIAPNFTPPPPPYQNSTLTSQCGSCFLPSNGNLNLTGGILNLAPGNYYVCSVSLSGQSTLNVQGTAAAPVTLYIEPPGALVPGTSNTCSPPVVGGVPQAFQVSGGASMTSTSTAPNSFLVEVDGTPPHGGGAVSIAGGSSTAMPMTVIAPYSDVTLSGNSQSASNVVGGIIGYTVTVTGTALFSMPSSLPPSGGVPPVYHKGPYIQCSAAPPSGSPPDAGC